MKKSSTDTCCLTLPLQLEKWQEDRLAKRFEIARQIYNTMVHAQLKKLRAVKHSSQYRKIQQEISALDWKKETDKPRLRTLYKERDKLLRDNGFTEYGFKSAIKDYYKHFNANIGSSVAVHGIAPQVWAAFEKMLFQKDGKQVHFKRAGDIHSLRGFSVSGKSGGVEIIFRGTYIEWKGLKLPLKLSANNAYESEMLSYRVKYVRLLRKPGKSKDRWYAQLVLEGKPVVKRDPVSGAPVHPIGHGQLVWTLTLRRWHIPPRLRLILWNWQIRCRISSKRSAVFNEKWTEAGERPTPPITTRTAPSNEASD